MQKIIKSRPPNYDQIAKRFDLAGKYPVFSYGDVIYNPSGRPIPDHLMVHEGIHQIQQNKMVYVYPDESPIENWWKYYLEDKEFRLSQEVEAYQAQYQFIKSTGTRQQKRYFLNSLATDLSSAMYGNMVTFNKAKELIQNENSN